MQKLNLNETNWWCCILEKENALEHFNMLLSSSA
jgi:hypothetical protein